MTTETFTPPIVFVWCIVMSLLAIAFAAIAFWARLVMQRNTETKPKIELGGYYQVGRLVHYIRLIEKYIVTDWVLVDTHNLAGKQIRRLHWKELDYFKEATRVTPKDTL